jgi:hypothetical protein
MPIYLNSQLLSTSTNIAQAQNSGPANMDRLKMADITAVVAGANPANIVFTGAVNDLCTTATDNGFTSGVKVRFTTTGTLPAGLATGTDYYLAVISTTTFKVCTTQANVLTATYVDITNTGTGVHTVSVQTTLAGTLKLQKTNSTDDEISKGTAVWVDLDDTEIYNGANSYTVSAAATKNWLVDVCAAKALRLNAAVTSGTITIDCRCHAKS